jgi:hypothetical protein
MAVAQVESRSVRPLKLLDASQTSGTCPQASLAGMTRATWLFCLSLGWLALMAAAIGFVFGRWW